MTSMAGYGPRSLVAATSERALAEDSRMTLPLTQHSLGDRGDFRKDRCHHGVNERARQGRICVLDDERELDRFARPSPP